MKSALVSLFLLSFAVVAGAEGDFATMPVENLISELAQIDSPAPGLHGTASAIGFIAEDKPPRFDGGVLGSPAPKTSPQMRELARREITVLPQLIGHFGAMSCITSQP